MKMTNYQKSELKKTNKYYISTFDSFKPIIVIAIIWIITVVIDIIMVMHE